MHDPKFPSPALKLNHILLKMSGKKPAANRANARLSRGPSSASGTE